MPRTIKTAKKLPGSLRATAKQIGNELAAKTANPIKPGKLNAAVEKIVAKPVVAKPATVKAEQARTERSKLLGEAHIKADAFYNGASSTIHASRGPKLSDVIARIKHPIQKPGNGPTERDESQLIATLAFCDPKTGVFDAVSRGFDLGVCSRNAHSGFYSVNSANQPFLTPAGFERARAVAKRAKA